MDLYEQKYKEAFERAKKLYGQGTITECLGYVFPELKESEDEKIKRELRNDLLLYVPTPERYIAWLEKQGEQKLTIPKWKYKKDHTPLLRDSIILNRYGCVAKSPSGAIVSDVWVLDYDELAKLPKEVLEKQGEQPTDKIKPRFKVGDWIVTPENKVLQITSIEGTCYKFNNESHYWEICYCNEKCHLWAINDAKDGDVLASKDGNEILIFRNLDTSTSFSSYYNVTGRGNFGWANNCFIPATKEQRDLLFAKMKEEGYEWDSEKKEVKKIEHKMLDADEVIAWLRQHICTACWDKPDEAISQRIEKFKEDFGLC